MTPFNPPATIGFAAPASGCPEGALTAAQSYFETKGFTVKTGKCVYQNHRFLSGTDADRAKEINDFYADNAVDAIFAARGGYGSARLLPLIDYTAVRAHPKPFVGLSDTTALQNALLAKADAVTLTGCVMYRHGGAFLPSVTEKYLWAAINGEAYGFDTLTPLTKGRASGRLIGGCLSIFASLLGTPYLPDLNDKILLLEDVGEQPYAVDRLLTHCALAGVFERVKGVVFGRFHACVSKDENDGTIEDVLTEWGKKLTIPAVTGLNYGHQENSAVLPLGGDVFLNASAGVLEIKERTSNG